MIISKPLLGFVAYSGTGKTTLLLKLIPLLKANGLRLGMVKHSHHGFEIDIPGKDSYRLRQAGADQTLIASSGRIALVKEIRQPAKEAHLKQVLQMLDLNELDLILVEGFKHESFPKIEVYRPSLGHPLMFPQDPDIIAVACDGPLTVATALPILEMNKPAEIVKFIEEKILTD